MTDRTRRRVLRLTGAAAGTAGLTSLAGCASESSPETTATDTTPSDATSGPSSDGSLPAFREWLVAPGEVGRQHYEFGALDVSAALEHESAFGGTNPAADIISQTELSDAVSASDLTAAYFVSDGAIVMVGAYDRDALAQTLVETGREETDTYRGYTFYESEYAATYPFTALSDEALMLVYGEDKRTKAEGILDAKAGDAARYHAANDDCRTLLARLGDGTLTIGRTYDEADYFENVVAGGISWTVTGETTTYRAPVVFEQGAADAEAVTDALDGHDGFASASVSTTGRTVVTTGMVDPDDLTTFELPWNISGSESTTSPQAKFTFEYDSTATDDSGTGVVTITHDGGDTIRASELSIRGDGIVDPSGATPDVTRTGLDWKTAGGDAHGEKGGDPAIVSGDFVTVGARNDYDISVVWEADDGETSATLAADKGPDTS